jgi:tetratricopeptide (TPR) repeat protein
MVGDERAQKSGKEILKLKILSDLDEIDAKREDPLRDRKRLDALHKLGNISQTIGDWDDALRYYDEVLQLAKRVGDQGKMADAHKGRGHIFKRRSNWDDAITEFNAAIEISKKTNYAIGMADAYRGLGYVYWRMGEYDKAMKHHDLAFEWVHKTKDAALTGTVHIEKGLVHSDLGELDAAAKEYAAAIAILGKERDYQQLARAHNNLGDVYLQQEDWHRAIKHFDECAECSQHVNHMMMLAWSLFNSAEAMCRLGMADEAIVKCKDSLAILEKLNDAVGTVAVHRNLGLAYGVKHEWGAAEKEFKEATRLVGNIKSPFNVAHVQLEYGRMLIDKGETKRGRNMLKAAANIFGDIGATKYRDMTLSTLGKK